MKHTGLYQNLQITQLKGLTSNPKSVSQYFVSISKYLTLCVPMFENCETALKLKMRYKIRKNSNISLKFIN